MMRNNVNLTHWNSSVEGPLSESALRRKLERLGYSVTRYVYPPGTYFPDHAHGQPGWHQGAD